MVRSPSPIATRRYRATNPDLPQAYRTPAIGFDPETAGTSCVPGRAAPMPDDDDDSQCNRHDLSESLRCACARRRPQASMTSRRCSNKVEARRYSGPA